jgi:transcriptional regulator with XRE-family HTH domain
MECHIPNKLRFYRRCYAYSQKKVARLLGLSDTSVLSKWENGITMPGIIQVFRLARMYRTEPQNLYEEHWKKVEQECSLLGEDENPFKSNQTFYV